VVWQAGTNDTNYLRDFRSFMGQVQFGEPAPTPFIPTSFWARTHCAWVTSVNVVEIGLWSQVAIGQAALGGI